jgi:hypothetical protein
MKRVEIRGKCLLVYFVVALSVFSFGAARPVIADDGEGDLVNYSFAIWLGSGFYNVADADKRFAFLRVPFAYTFREGQYDQPAFRDRLGFKLLLPALVGYQEETDTNFDFFAGAFVPGLAVHIPVNKYWILKPFGQFGVGNDTGDGDWQYIYGTGIRSLVSIPYKDFVFGIGNSIVVAENRNASTDDINGFSLLEAGLDIRTPLGFTLLNRQINTGVFFVASRFYNRVDFIKEFGNTERVNLIYTAGLTFEVDDGVSIWKIKLNRVGIDYRWGNAGFQGIGFNMGFPF